MAQGWPNQPAHWPAIADLYYEALEEPVCVNPDGLDLSFDVAGSGTAGDEPDCRVSLADLGAFAADWLNCGLLPKTACY
ncbi:MAG TPA: hypothetical protein P5279_08985 [Anaerohalosphaeraceae bacterium]|nr:hypothetical protein [Anaerohalosphaeraceae bacterium]HRT50614.1 hypothetical protein [Anaerohalosphaeraceae bacterium]HRT86561.1 hypothetical protein [Anaerohalosphaeraceae bacterium]